MTENSTNKGLRPSLRAQRSNPDHGYDSSGLLRRFAPRNDAIETQRSSGGELMTQTFHPKFDRRTLIKGAAPLGAFHVASPFIIQPRGETAIPIAIVAPLTDV